MMTKTNYHTYDFTDSKYLLVCGDIHGDFDLLVERLCVLGQLRDTTCIVAGDCGFGFENKSAYDQIIMRNTQRMEEANNRIVFVRGNHDNPAYFDGLIIANKHFIAIPDYSIVKVAGHTVLCIGGATSIDRIYRKEAWRQERKHWRKLGYKIDDKNVFTAKYYWPDEQPVFNDELLTLILAENNIDTVVTHTAPSFCKFRDKTGLAEWAVEDKELLADAAHERAVMDAIYDKVKGQPITHWFYGHFHKSWQSNINGIFFKMLGIMEMYEI